MSQVVGWPRQGGGRRSNVLSDDVGGSFSVKPHLGERGALQGSTFAR